MANGHADVIDKGCEYGRMTRQMMADEKRLTDTHIEAVEKDTESLFAKIDSLNNFARGTLVSAVLMLIATILGIILK